jgi:Zn finger protein HypA/HybF involved in hydrogenase expression
MVPALMSVPKGEYMKKVSEALKEIEYECQCSKCNKTYIFKSKYFEPGDFDDMCPECYKNENYKGDRNERD